jgi:membrane fusion protein (multidrug efflux system)
VLALAAACGPAQGGPGGEPPPPASVEVTRVEPRLLRNVVHIPGQLTAAATVELRVEEEGVLEAIEFAEGATVEQGAVLFRLRDDEERAALQEAEAELALAEAVLGRTRRLVARDVSSTAELERVAAERDVAAARVERARVALARRTILAPFEGAMGALLVAPGDRVRTTTPLTRIDAIDRLQLEFSLPESALGLVSPGAPVRIRVAPYPEDRFDGAVYFVSPSVDPEARRFLVKAWIPNPGRRLRPGLFAEIEAEIERRPDAILVPESALVYGLEGTSVWRLDGDDRVHPVPVEVGVHQEGLVEIRSGLAPGDRVVVAGIHKVSAGEPVRPVESAPAPSPRTLAEDPAGPEAGAAPARGRDAS